LIAVIENCGRVLPVSDQNDRKLTCIYDQRPHILSCSPGEMALLIIHLIPACCYLPGEGKQLMDIEMQSNPLIQQKERIGSAHAIRILARGLGLLWDIVSWPVALALCAIEPLVRGILYCFALFGMLAALFLRYVGHRDNVPLVTVLAISLGCVAAVAFYRGLLRLLAHRAHSAR
jgi:hypothetical protein